MCKKSSFYLYGYTWAIDPFPDRNPDGSIGGRKEEADD